MQGKNSVYLKKVLGTALFSFFLAGCVDPVPPEFEYTEGLIFVEGFATTEPGTSFVSISQSALVFGVFKSVFETGADVRFKEVNTGETIQLTEQGEIYVPPDDFAADEGSSWELLVTLDDGTNLQSYPETALTPVDITNITAQYEPELQFVEIFGGKFVPGHRISVSFTDPINDQNFYYWTYRTYENLSLCERCYEGYFREGDCQRFEFPGTAGIPYFDYTCEVSCWRIRFPESISIFNDEFSNGKIVSNLAIGDLLLYTRENMVVEVQQFSLTPAAHQYYKVLKDLVDNNSSFNAPPPAGLIGNMFDPNDSEKFIFGRFTVAAATKTSLFIDRSTITEEPLETRTSLNFEKFGDPVPSPSTTIAPCSETRFRTAIPPEAWITN